MSFKGMPVHQIKEILRLSRAVKLGVWEIARSLRVSPATVSKYLEEAREVPWPLPEGWTEQTLQQALSPKVSGTEEAPERKRGLGSNSFGPEEAEGSDAPALVEGVP